MPSSCLLNRKFTSLSREADRQQKEKTAWKLVDSHLNELQRIVEKDMNHNQSKDNYLLYRNWYFQLLIKVQSTKIPQNHKLYEVLAQFHNNCVNAKHSNRYLAYQQLSSCVYRHSRRVSYGC